LKYSYICNQAILIARRKHVLLLLHLFNGLFSGSTWVSQHQKCNPFWILMKQEMMGWQWHQLDHMQSICTCFRQITMPVPHHSILRPDAPPTTQPIASTHWRHQHQRKHVCVEFCSHYKHSSRIPFFRHYQVTLTVEQTSSQSKILNRWQSHPQWPTNQTNQDSTVDAVPELQSCR